MIRRFVLRLLSFFRQDAVEAELSREIRSHLQLLEDEHVAKGMSRDDARLAARRAFGGVEQAFFAMLYSFLYATLPVEGGDRIVALENWDIDANNEMRRSRHDLVMWRREMKTVEEI